MSYLRVPTDTVRRASYYLDSVARDNGAGYGYIDPTRGTEAMSAAGLLCRMYMGWKREEPALKRGVEALAAIGPSPEDIYYNYYATQVLHHYEGDLWTKWNDQLRDPLVARQETQGHAAGSWFFEGDPHGALTGGRLYSTAMAAMTLEVYYRHMPLYSKRTTQDDLRK
jgi:hypothetical protein